MVVSLHGFGARPKNRSYLYEVDSETHKAA